MPELRERIFILEGVNFIKTSGDVISLTDLILIYFRAITTQNKLSDITWLEIDLSS